LLRIENAVEQLVVVHDGHDLPLGHVAQIRPRGQEDGRRELGQEVVGQVEVEVEAGQVALLLLLDLVDMELRKHHAALGVIRDAAAVHVRCLLCGLARNGHRCCDNRGSDDQNHTAQQAEI
jgi:hypothetical protein